MKTKPYPALCKDCKHSAPEKNNEWTLRCFHPVVNAKDSWALSGLSGGGSNCNTVREKHWPSPCGMRGALWESK